MDPFSCKFVFIHWFFFFFSLFCCFSNLIILIVSFPVNAFKMIFCLAVSYSFCYWHLTLSLVYFSNLYFSTSKLWGFPLFCFYYSFFTWLVCREVLPVGPWPLAETLPPPTWALHWLAMAPARPGFAGRLSQGRCRVLGDCWAFLLFFSHLDYHIPFTLDLIPFSW